MKFGVIGTGGVGGFYGGMVGKNGKEVVFVTKPKYLNALKEKGLTVKSHKHGTFTLKENEKVKFTDKIEELKDVDTVLLCVKSYDTENVAKELKSINGNFVVISIQNGIENEEILSRYLGIDRVIGATAFIGSYVKEPGVIVHEAAGLLETGEIINTTVTDRIKRIAKELEDAKIDVRISKNIHYTLWKKLMWNVAFNPYSVITKGTVGKLLKDKGTKSILKGLMRECQEVAKSYGIELKEETIDKYLVASDGLENYKTSMLLDFERGKRLEIDGITGALLRKAKKKNINIPFNEYTYKTVEFLEKIENYCDRIHL